MRDRFRRRVTLGVAAGVAAAFAVAGMASVGAAVSPAGEAASAKQYAEKVTICHRTGSKNPFRTIRISQNALKAHLKHGDAMGPCGPNAVFTMCHKTKNGKTKTLKVKGARKAGRALKKGDKLGKCKANKKQSKPAKPDKQKGKGKGKGKK
jgi:hypothetical protein